MGILSTDATDLLLDSDGELIVDTDSYLCAGVDAVAQACRIACLFIRGEWFMDLDQGLPLMESDAGNVDEDRAILGGKFIKARAESDYRKALKAVPGVGAVNFVTATFDDTTRTMNVAWEVVCEFDDVLSDNLVINDRISVPA